MSEASKLRMVFQTEGDAAAIANTRAVGRAVDDVADSGGRAGSRLGTMFSIAGGFLGAQAVSKVLEFGKGILFADAQAEQLKVGLQTVSGDRAESIYKNLQAFAAKTPFSFPELVQSAQNLEAFGLSSEKWMTTIGDTAAATNHSVDQVTQAVLDAATGQYERLKELNVDTRIEGDKLVFSYFKNGQAIEEKVDKTNKALIASTVQSIWNGQYAGAMEKQSKTFIGQWSTLKDNVSLRLQEMSGGIFGFVTSAVGFFNDIFANGFLGAVRGAFGDGVAEFLGGIGSMVTGVISAFGEGTPVADLVAKLPESWQPVGDAIFHAADAIGQLWTNVSQGDWGAVVADLQQLAKAGLDLNTIVVGAAFRLADDTVTNIWDWFKGAVGIGTVASGDGTGGPDSDRTITLGDVSVKAAFSLADKAESVGNFVSTLGDDIVAGISAAADFGSDIAGAVWGQITSLDWLPIITTDSFGAGSSFGTAIHDAIVAGVKAAINLVSDFSADDCLHIVESIGAGVVAAAAAAPAAVLAVSTAIASFIAGAVTGLVFGDDVDFSSVFDKIVAKIVGVIDAGVGKAAEISRAIVSTIDAALDPDMWSDVASSIASWLWDAIAKKLVDLAPSSLGIKDKIREALGLGEESDTPIADSQLGGWANIDLSKLQGVADGLKNMELGPRAQEFADLGTKATEFDTTFATASGNIATSAGKINMVFMGMVSLAQAKFGQMVDLARSTAYGIVSTFASLAGELSGIGYQIGASLAAGLWEAVPAVIAAANAIAAAVEIAVRARLQIQSPSRVMMRLGEHAVEGFLMPLRSAQQEASSLLAFRSSGGLSAVRPAGMASSHGGGSIVYLFESGSYFGPGALAEIERHVASGQAKRIDRSISRSRLAESY